jgi:hypothetical protein
MQAIFLNPCSYKLMTSALHKIAVSDTTHADILDGQIVLDPVL